MKNGSTTASSISASETSSTPDVKSTPLNQYDATNLRVLDFNISPEEADQPVLLKFQNMPKLIGWFQKVHEKDSANMDEDAKPKIHFNQDKIIVTRVEAPITNQRDNVQFNLSISDYEPILNLDPTNPTKGSQTTSKKKFRPKRTRSIQCDVSLQKIKSTIVNDVVKKVTSYFRMELKPKLETSIKSGQCKCGQHCKCSGKGKVVIQNCACTKPKRVSRGTTMRDDVIVIHEANASYKSFFDFLLEKMQSKSC